VAYATEDNQLGIAPAVLIPVAAKVVPIVSNVIKSLLGGGKDPARIKANAEAGAAVKAGYVEALPYLKARARLTGGYTMQSDLPISDAEARAGHLVASWASAKARGDAAKWVSYYPKSDSNSTVAATGAPPGSPNAIPASTAQVMSSASMPLLLGGGLLVAYLVSRRK
jgi:hypothetical protein